MVEQDARGMVLACALFEEIKVEINNNNNNTAITQSQDGLGEEDNNIRTGHISCSNSKKTWENIFDFLSPCTPNSICCVFLMTLRRAAANSSLLTAPSLNTCHVPKVGGDDA